ncbi:MAG TPA: DUF2283 domain-containing protein [Longimicrobiales bacterium]|nr:DUF2283 domain-containing protein [Longimicrobiales bacterium]
MEERYLEIIYRDGRAFAAYLYLPRSPGVTSSRTEVLGEGLVMDYDADGHAIGLEITAPGQVTIEQINQALARVGEAPLSAEELAPLAAA